jgi:putative Mg2+ transporter-C (MgtC) family protein
MILDAYLSIREIIMMIIIPLGLTFIFAGLIGLERQNVGKAAGISSHILVAMGAAGIAIMQRLMFQSQLGMIDMGVEPEGQRVIAQVITGIGFVGAGVIIKDQSNVVKGITTAATIWSTAMVGLIIGSGYLILGSILGLFLVIFIAARDISRGFNPFRPHHSREHIEDHH